VQEVLTDLMADNDFGQVEITVSALPSCKGDNSLIKQALVNLISNALKYSSKCEKAQIEIYSMMQDAKTIYVIKDNGAGFDMQYADKLFGVFQRLHADED